MRAVTFHGERDVRVEDKDKPEIEEPTDAILRVTTSAVCGTDLHFYRGQELGLSPGTTLGHEFVGVVDEVGDAVRYLSAGDRAVASMYTCCGACQACSRQDYFNCPYWAMFGCGMAFGDMEGGQAEYVRVPLADMTLAPVPEALTDEDVVLTTDILPTAYTAMVKSGVKQGDTVAVVGAGPVGQLAVMCAYLFGASKVMAIDLVADRLKEAEALGAIPINAAEVDPADAVFDHTGNLGADVVIEAVGMQGSVDTCWAVAKKGATIAMIGLLLEEAWPSSCGDNWLRQIQVKPVIGEPIKHRWDLFKLIEAKRLDPAGIISHTMPLGDAVEAYRMFDAREATKIILKP